MLLRTILVTLLLAAFALPAAAGGLGRLVGAEPYGEYRLVEDAQRRFWTRDEWLVRPAGSPSAKSFGHLTAIADRPATIWLEYGPGETIHKVTVILDSPLALRDFGRCFPELAARAAGGELYVTSGYPRDGLAAVIPAQSGDLLATFFLDAKYGATRPNTHSLVKGFSLARLTAAEKGRLPMTAKDAPPESRDGTWRKIGNFLRPGLHFSEPLVARRRTDMIVIHHTKIENMTIASIHDLHLRNGWAGIGYHKVILPDGTVADGRPEYAIGAHAKGVNSRSVGVSLVGDFDVGRPTPAQMAALVALTADLAGKYGISASRVVGHRDVYDDTTCPGRMFPWAEFKQALQGKSRTVGK
jgi:hypothetical protein